MHDHALASRVQLCDCQWQFVLACRHLVLPLSGDQENFLSRCLARWHGIPRMEYALVASEGKFKANWINVTQPLILLIDRGVSLDESAIVFGSPFTHDVVGVNPYSTATSKTGSGSFHTVRMRVGVTSCPPHNCSSSLAVR